MITGSVFLSVADGASVCAVRAHREVQFYLV